MPSPQALVTFVTVLFVLLVMAHGQLGYPPVPSAVVSALVAFGLAWLVDRSVPDDETDDEDEITVESELEAARRE